MIKKNLKLLFLTCFCSQVIIGCITFPEPVPAYKRGTLAKSNMALEVDPFEAGIRQSTFASKEGASGGYTGTGGGCGCN